MKRWALIRNGVVDNVIEQDGMPLVPGFAAIDVTGLGVGPGMVVLNGEFEPATGPVPESVTMRQARLALWSIGKLGAVNDAIAALPEPQRTQATIEWEYSNEVQRNQPLVLALGPALGLDLDALFIAAGAL